MVIYIGALHYKYIIYDPHLNEKLLRVDSNILSICVIHYVSDCNEYIIGGCATSTKYTSIYYQE